MTPDVPPNDPRAVWQNEPKETLRMSPTELLNRIAQRDTAMARKQRVLYAGLIFNIILFVVLAFVFPMPMERVGCALTAVGWACVLQQVRRHRMGQKAREAMAGAPSIDFYRTNLERQRDFAAGWPWLLAAVPGPVLFFIGVTQQVADPFVQKFVYAMFPVLIALVAAAVALQARHARRFQREIDEVTQLQREQSR
jgi:hypothetical protein